jgi:hypothetical protein
VNWREKTVECLFGGICLTHSYYHCRCCGASQMPWDEALRLGKRRVTLGAEEVISLAGLLTSFGQAADAAAKLQSQWCHQLKHQGGAALLAEWEQLDTQRWRGWRSETYREQVQYFRRHQHRMDYPHYLANGWHIGSGPVESGCKRVVTQRLNGAAMRWKERGSNTMCQLRALLLCHPDQWTAYWTPSKPNVHLQN